MDSDTRSSWHPAEEDRSFDLWGRHFRMNGSMTRRSAVGPGKCETLHLPQWQILT